VPHPVAARRLEIFAAARRDPTGFLRFDPSRLRFHLGASLSDLRIPVQVAEDAGAIVRAAATEIALLLATHHKRFVPPEDVDRLILREEFASLPRPAVTLGPSGGGPDLRAAAQLATRAHPALTGGVVCAWMGRGGRGRSLTGLFIAALGQGLAEMRASRVQEETPLVVALALFGELMAAAGTLRDLLPGPPHDRFLRAAAVTALWIAARTGLARAWRDGGRDASDPLLARLEAVLSPAPLLGGHGGATRSGSTLYGCELLAGVPRADDVGERLASGFDADAAAAVLAQALAAEEDLSRRAEAAVATSRIREMLLAGLTEAEGSGRGAAMEEFRALYCAPAGLAGALADDAARKDLAGRLAETAANLGPVEAVGHLERAARALKAWKAKDPAAAVGLRREQARAEYAEAATALLCDGALERIVTPARRALMARTGAEAEGGAEAEWEAGRLYRVSAHPGPILCQAEARPMGHLFADVKDFTRRTGILGQAAMAEFLRGEFYLPILVAAKRHFAGMQHLADRGGISLNNLVGDAISLSGDIESMVALAMAIRRLLSAYEERLRREVTNEMVAGHLARLEERHRRALAAVAAELKGAREALAGAEPGTRREAEAQHQVARASAEEARLGAEHRRAVARARGEGLEAGVFLSYGAVPLVITIDDDVFGRCRVAIADKINESARGTARTPAARARADALLAAERAARNRPDLQHAWSVFIGQPLTVVLPPEAEDRALAAARAGDLSTALRAAAGPAREAIEAAARVGGDAPGEIYNSGAALAGEALEAFLEAVGTSRVVRRLELPPEEIPPELRARWWFGAVPESLVVSFHPDGRLAELFRYVGKAAFKGLGEVRVWEICADAGAPAALAQALGAAWFKGRGA